MNFVSHRTGGWRNLKQREEGGGGGGDNRDKGGIDQGAGNTGCEEGRGGGGGSDGSRCTRL